MYETVDEIAALDSLLRDSLRGSTEHLRSISYAFAKDRLLTELT